MRILILPDLHTPFHHKKAVAWAIKLAHKLRPDAIVQIGDAADQLSFSRYPRAIKLTPVDEWALARAALEDLWDKLPKNCKRYQMLGNHDDRVLKRVLEKVPELADIVGRSITEMYSFDGVTLVHESELLLDGIIFQHGHRSKLGDHSAFNQCSTVCGHSHIGGVVFGRNRLGTYFELNAGFLGDVSTDAFAYQSQKMVNKCTLGVGYVDQDGPRFIAFPG